MERESNANFSGNEQQVIFTRNSNLYSMNLTSGEVAQLTNFQTGSKAPETKPNEQERWLKQDQLAMFEVLKERSDKRKEAEKIQKADQAKRSKEIFLDNKQIDNQTLSPDGRFITYRLTKNSGAKNTIVPNYVTESGFTEDIPGRTKVGYALSSAEFFIYDTQKDTVLMVSTKNLEGISDKTDYAKDYVKTPAKNAKKDSTKLGEPRKTIISGPSWSEDGAYAVVSIRTFDNKDRWLALLEASTGKLTVLDRQRDEARIGKRKFGYRANLHCPCQK